MWKENTGLSFQWQVFFIMKYMLNPISVLQWEMLKFTFLQDSVQNSSMKGIQCNTIHKRRKSPTDRSVKEVPDVGSKKTTGEQPPLLLGCHHG